MMSDSESDSDFEEISDCEEYKEVKISSDNGPSMEEEYEKLYETYGTESYGKMEEIIDFADCGGSYIGESGKWGKKWGLINEVNKIKHLIHLQNESEKKIAHLTKMMQEFETPAKQISEKLSLYTTRQEKFPDEIEVQLAHLTKTMQEFETKEKRVSEKLALYKARQNKLPAKIKQLERSIVRIIDWFMKDAICFIIKYMKHPHNQSVIRITDAIDFYENQKNKKILSKDEKKQILELEKKKEDLSNQIFKKEYIEIKGLDETVTKIKECCETLKKLPFDIKSVDLSTLVSEIETKIKEYSSPEKKKALWNEYYDLWEQRGSVYHEIAIISGDLDKLYDLLYLSQYDNCIWCELKSFYYLIKLPKITSDKKLKLHEPYITGESFFENNLELYCKSPKVIELCKHFFMHLRHIPKRYHEPL